jgi:hypothetical protein
MSIATELEKLKQLMDSGVLSLTEFEVAKSKLLETLGPENTTGTGVNQIGKAANRWVNLQWVSYGVGLIAVVLMVVFFFIPLLDDIRTSRAEFDVDFKATNKRIEKAREDMDARSKKFDEDFEKQKKEMDAFHKKNFPN